MDTSTTQPEATPMIDVSAVPLGELIANAGDSVLAAALRRIVDAAISEPGGDVSEFESSI